eukprot:TRINITY_DN569_c0_g1_i5.p1 TRINITY_DN569_c0_g1~~TRINITY_DN569_c0_g1_i5.p1  ORF type:complete len:210 (+),score=36.24 TRINITY_DN569_c0_g1_i5:197-826(+)
MIENSMDNYDNEALCCLGLLVIFGLALNISEICFITQQLTHSSTLEKGALFDCTFYPLISRLICVSYISVVSLVCLLSSILLVCYESTGIECMESAFVTLVYFVFGPLLAGVCFFFLARYEQFGFVCDANNQKVYNPLVWAFITFLCFLSILVTVLTFAKTLMMRVNKMLKGNTYITRVGNWMLCETEDFNNELEESEALSQENIISQL